MTAALRNLMLVLLQILAATYFIAINVYAFTLMLAAKRADEEGDCKRRVRDGSVFVAAGTKRRLIPTFPKAKTISSTVCTRTTTDIGF